MKKIIVLITVIAAFIYTNFIGWRFSSYGLALSPKALGFPWIYSRRLCGDTIPSYCGGFTEPEKLTWNIFVWALLFGFLLYKFYKQKRV